MNLIKSLRFKLIAFSFLIEVVMLSFLISNGARLTESHLTAQAIKQLNETKSNFQASLSALLAARDYSSLNSILDEYTNHKKITYIFVQKDGQIIASSKWDKNQPIPQVNEIFDTELEIFNTKTDINYLGQNYGTVYFGIDTSFLKNAKRELLTQSFMIALFEIILSIVLLLSIGYWLTKHLLDLTDAAEKIANNDFNFKLNINTNDEIGLLAKTFNKMSAQITNQITTIQTQNEIQKELIKSLDDEVNRVKAILENAGDAIHILDLNGNIFMFSDSFAKSLGYTNEETANLNVADWDLDFEPIMIYELIIHPRTFEATHTRKDGSTFSVEIRTAGIELDKTMYLYAASRDITERKLAQEQLIQKDILLQQQSRLAALGEMIGNIAHQWRQPLSMISTIATSYKMRKEFGIELSVDDLIEEMETVNKNAQYLSKTIDDFRNFFNEKQEKEEFKVSSVLIESTNIIKASYENNFIKLHTNFDENILHYGTKSMLSQVVLNLLSNAKDALNEKKVENKVVKMTLERNNNLVIIKVKDNGGGVNDEIKNKIFDPYFTTKHKNQGTGLGLYMSMQIMKNHFDGVLEIENIEDEDGYGACFAAKFNVCTK